MNHIRITCMKSEQATTGQTIAGLAIIGVVVVSVFVSVFANDRRTVIRCIDAIAEAARGGVIYSDMQRLRQQVSDADDVTITNRSESAFSGATITRLSFTADGRQSGIMCAM